MRAVYYFRGTKICRILKHILKGASLKRYEDQLEQKELERMDREK